jgi:phosphopantothenoylcysteine decarboxylase/phosphopantothenate--cysteine ligase
LTNSSPRGKERSLKIWKTLKNKTVLLGVSGGIAAYKSIDLVRRIKDEGASVSVVMTDAARHFVTPLSLQTASQNTVYTSLFDHPLAHIRLPSEADLMVVAPATANIIAKFANGIADDLLSTCFLAFRGTAVIAPSMNWRMYENPYFRENLSKLVSSGIIQVGPEKGDLACGEKGKGRMAEVPEILETIKGALSLKDLAGEKIVVTAGPTREYLDPVRFISNRSSGKMGFALAREARDRGAGVVLISGPSTLGRPSGVDFVGVETAEEMLGAVEKEMDKGASVLIMAAAVSDFGPAETSSGKLEKGGGLALKLRPTADIVSTIAGRRKRPFIIGFAAETGKNINRAKKKMTDKGMDMVVFNDVTEPGAGFDVDTNRVVIIDGRGETRCDLMSKEQVAEAVIDRLVEMKT